MLPHEHKRIFSEKYRQKKKRFDNDLEELYLRKTMSVSMPREMLRKSSVQHFNKYMSIMQKKKMPRATLAVVDDMDDNGSMEDVEAFPNNPEEMTNTQKKFFVDEIERLQNLLTEKEELPPADSTEIYDVLFSTFDEDGNGKLSKDEITKKFQEYLSFTTIDISKEQFEVMARQLMGRVTTDDNNEIDVKQFKELVMHDELFKEIFSDMLSTVQTAMYEGDARRKSIVPEKLKSSVNNQVSTIHKKISAKYWKNNRPLIVFMGLYWLANLVCVIEPIISHHKDGAAICIARIGGMLLNFNSILVIILMLRRLTTAIRNSKVGKYVPIDRFIDIHRQIGFVILFATIIHVSGHIANNVVSVKKTRSCFPQKHVYVGHENYTVGDLVLRCFFNPGAKVGWLWGLAPLTGWLLLIIIIIIIGFAMPCVRRSGKFQVFYITHKLYWIYWPLLFFHATDFKYWLIVPMILVIIEQLLRRVINRSERAMITSINLLPSKVTQLVIQTSPGFKFNPSDYIFLRVPSISKYEWHPFTISSSPLMKNELWLHIRSAGNWTTQLYNNYDNILECSRSPVLTGGAAIAQYSEDNKKIVSNPYQRKSHIDPITHFEVKSILLKEPVFIDGPYSSPSNAINDAEHAVLIGTGIGITPFASILHTLMYTYENNQKCCPQCQYSWFDTQWQNQKIAFSKTKKVDFVWVNRDQKEFEWFISLLADLEKKQEKLLKDQIQHGDADVTPKNFLDIHLYLTRPFSKKTGDLESGCVKLGLRLVHADGGRCAITGLTTQTQTCRPNWEELFSKFSKSDNGKVSVMFCGSPTIAQILTELCIKYDFKFYSENF
ncbi:hypothetical protein SNEBB_006809 [Seison nebaliae]|nr:hypothetical protein SNEBB_006809 [Seison nebaliae]